MRVPRHFLVFLAVWFFSLAGLFGQEEPWQPGWDIQQVFFHKLLFYERAPETPGSEAVLVDGLVPLDPGEKSPARFDARGICRNAWA